MSGLTAPARITCSCGRQSDPSGEPGISSRDTAGRHVWGHRMRGAGPDLGHLQQPARSAGSEPALIAKGLLIAADLGDLGWRHLARTDTRQSVLASLASRAGYWLDSYPCVPGGCKAMTTGSAGKPQPAAAGNGKAGPSRSRGGSTMGLRMSVGPLRRQGAAHGCTTGRATLRLCRRSSALYSVDWWAVPDGPRFVRESRKGRRPRRARQVVKYRGRALVRPLGPEPRRAIPPTASGGCPRSVGILAPSHQQPHRSFGTSGPCGARPSRQTQDDLGASPC